MYFVFKHKLHPRAPRYPPLSSPPTKPTAFFQTWPKHPNLQKPQPERNQKAPVLFSCFSLFSSAPRAHLASTISYHTTHTRAPTQHSTPASLSIIILYSIRKKNNALTQITHSHQLLQCAFLPSYHEPLNFQTNYSIFRTHESG